MLVRQPPGRVKGARGGAGGRKCLHGEADEERQRRGIDQVSFVVVVVVLYPKLRQYMQPYVSTDTMDLDFDTITRYLSKSR